MENTNFPLVVLTGGPGAGKTAVLELSKNLFCKEVAVLPEAASIIFNGGFWRLESHTAKLAIQRAIYHVQSELEFLAMNEDNFNLGLCDRGTLDGLAYWDNSEQSFFDTFNTSYEKEYSKYHAVVHLRTPSVANGYNYSNPVRTETPEEAMSIDKRIHDIWKNHPHYYQVESKEFFLEKARETFLTFHSKIRQHVQRDFFPKKLVKEHLSRM